MSKTYVIAAAVALALLGGGALWVTQGRVDLPPSLTTAAVAVDSAATTSSEAALVPDMVLGQVEAPVTVIEYASFTCPHCRNFHETVFGDLKANYVDTGKIRFVYREVYFDKYGLWAGMVARCGGPEKYFGIADMIYATQRDWLAPGEDAGIAANLRKIGLKAGLSEAAVDACLNDGDMAKAMVATFQTHGRRDEINSTPSFIIDGQKYANMSYEDFAKALDEKLAN